MKRGDIAAIILAAGYSSRFQGAFKPLATIATKPVLEHAVHLFQSAGIRDIVVVVGHRWDAMGHKLRHLPARFAINENYSHGMFSSIQTGVENLSGAAEAFFLLPVDIPLVRIQTVQTLMQAYDKKKGGILYPVFKGVRGHPPLVARRLARAIGAWGDSGGLRTLLDRYKDCAADVPVADEFIHLDMDTRYDLISLRKRYQRYEIPSGHECLALQQLWHVPEPVIAHCRAVTRVAGMLARLLNKSGCSLDTDLLRAAALLHDCAKTSCDHAHTGAALLADAGFAKTADVVSRHMDIGSDNNNALTETHILYLADKLVLETELVTLDERLQRMLPRFRSTARQMAIRKLGMAQDIQKRVEMLTGMPMDATLSKTACRLSDSTSPAASVDAKPELCCC